MKKKGQALVEFIIILPIILLILLGILDMGRVLSTKITLEDKMSDVVSLYENGNSLKEITTKLKLKDTSIDAQPKDDYIDITLTKEIEIITPGLNIIFNNPYKLQVTRSILNDI